MKKRHINADALWQILALVACLSMTVGIPYGIGRIIDIWFNVQGWTWLAGCIGIVALSTALVIIKYLIIGFGAFIEWIYPENEDSK